MTFHCGNNLMHIDCKAIEARPTNPKRLPHGLPGFVPDLDDSSRAWVPNMLYLHDRAFGRISSTYACLCPETAAVAWVEYTRLNPAPNSGGVINASSGTFRAILTCALLFHHTHFVMENVIALHWNQCSMLRICRRISASESGRLKSRKIRDSHQAS